MLFCKIKIENHGGGLVGALNKATTLCTIKKNKKDRETFKLSLGIRFFENFLKKLVKQ